MMVFVGSSAFIAYLIGEDANYRTAAAIWKRLAESDSRLVTTNYVVVETCALLHRRSGMSIVRTLLQDVVPAVVIEWVDVGLHSAALSMFLDSARRGPSIVDCVSFAAMHKLGITTAFAFDPHFAEQGFHFAVAE
jgi:predicted nucleic acid-binding protein